MSYPKIQNNSKVTKPSDWIGFKIAFYEDFCNNLKRELPDYVKILESVGNFISSYNSTSFTLKWNNDLALVLNKCHRAAKHVLDLLISDFLGCDNISRVSNTIYQSVIGTLFAQVKDYSMFADIDVDGVFRDPISVYPNVFHYLHSGALTINEEDGSVIVAADVDSVLEEYCSLYVETSDEAKFIYLYMQSREIISNIADERDQLQSLEDDINKIIPNKESFFDRFDLLNGYLRFRGEWLKGSLESAGGGLDYSIVCFLQNNFVPNRKQRAAKCYDVVPDIDGDEPYVFAISGYKNPNPSEADKNKWPELYGQSEYSKFMEKIEEEAKEYPSYMRESFKAEQRLKYIGYRMSEVAKKYEHYY